MYLKNSVASRHRMCAPSESASAMKMMRPYRRASMSKVRPEPAPTTWMIEAHSVFFSMSPTEAFCTLRILPRIGSRAWNSELRASFAVPNAESPSTMNSSERSTSVLRQSTSLAGSEEDSKTLLRRWASRCRRAARPRGSDHFLQHLSSLAARRALRRGQKCRQLPAYGLGDQPSHGRRTEYLLGLALELRLGQPYGDDCGHPFQDVVLDDLLPRPQQSGSLQHVGERPGQGAFETCHMRPALRRGDDVDVRADGRLVTGAPPHGDVHIEVALYVPGFHVTLGVEHRNGLGEPVLSPQPDDVGDRFVSREEFAKFGDATVVLEPVLAHVRAACVGDLQGQPGHQEARLPGSLIQIRPGDRCVLEEDLSVRPEGDPRSGQPLRCPPNLP